MPVPDFIRQFYCYQIKVSFRATFSVSIDEKWYFLPRYALGNALKNSPKHSALYELLFKPEFDRRDLANTATPLIIRADKPKRTAFSKNEKIDIYITLITIEESILKSFIYFLPEWQHFDFFKTYRLSYVGYAFFDPKRKLFYADLTFDKAKIDFDFFNQEKPIWKNTLEIKFITPTTFKIKDEFTQSIHFDALINRIAKRCSNIYRLFLTNKKYTSEAYVTPPDAEILLSKVSIPITITKKRNKNYDLAGIMGSICYEVPYREADALLLSIARYIHVGLHTVSGNGYIIAKGIEVELFKKVVDKLLYCKSPTNEQRQFQKNITSFAKLEYTPPPYRIIFIPKSDGTLRELSIPEPDDMLMQQTMVKVLYKKCNSFFLPQSVAYRKGKSAIVAINTIQQWRKQYGNQKLVLRIDIDSFFDKVSHLLLFDKLEAIFRDPFILHYLQLWVQSAIVNTKQNTITANDVGLPQGSPLSPLLSNIFLHDLDQMIASEITPFFIRYADDFILLIDKDENPIQVLQKITDFLFFNLALTLNKDFNVAELQDNFSFLGIEFLPEKQLKIDDKKIALLPRKIADAIRLDTQHFTKLKEKIAGYKNYYGKLLSAIQLQQIDHIIFTAYGNYLTDHPNQSTALEKIGGIFSPFIAEKWLLKPAANPKAANKDITTKTVAQKLKLQERKFLKEIAKSSEIIVAESPAYVSLSKNKVKVAVNGKTVTTQPLNSVKQISIMAEGIGVSSPLVKAVQKYDIPIVFYNHVGEAYATIQKPLHLLPSIIELQLSLADNKKIAFITTLIENKLTNQCKLIKYYRKYYQKDAAIATLFDRLVAKMTNEIAKCNPAENYEETRKQLFLTEARAATYYWRAFGALVAKSGYTFAAREQQGATDIVNQMLNYGYAILESKIMRTIHTWQLSPQVAYLHSRHDQKPTLCYDLMEAYRAFVVDRSILAILSKHEAIAQDKNGLLTLDTRKKIISKINERFFGIERIGSKRLSLNDAMHSYMEDFLLFVKNNKKTIKFYTPQW